MYQRWIKSLAKCMEPFTILFSKQAHKDIERLIPKQKTKLQQVLQQVIAINPYVGKALI
jgi:toxin YoeB